MFPQFDGAEYVVVIGKVKKVYRNYFHARANKAKSTHRSSVHITYIADPKRACNITGHRKTVFASLATTCITPFTPSLALRPACAHRLFGCHRRAVLSGVSPQEQTPRPRNH